MNIFKPLVLLAAFSLPLATAQAAVDVTFTNPEKYRDARPRGYVGAKERDAMLVKLRQHLEKQGERVLKPGQDLKIEVLDVDLAGRVEWWNHYLHDVRIMRDIYAPAVKLRYTLTENGAVLASGEERVIDMGYLRGITSVAMSSDPLRYEKTMLTDWLRKRFAAFGASAS